MHVNSVIVLAFVSISAFAVSADQTGQISPGYLEIEAWIKDRFKDDSPRIDKFTKYRVGAMSAPESLKKTGQDWSDFIKLDVYTCEKDSVDVLKRVLENSGSIAFIKGGEKPEHEIQELIIQVASMCAKHCKGDFEDSGYRVINSLPLRPAVKFVESLSKKAQEVCNQGGRYKIETGALQPITPTGAQFYQCVRNAPEIFVQVSKQSLDDATAEGGDKSAESDDQEVTLEFARKFVESKVRQCKLYMSYLSETYELAEYFYQISDNQYGPRFNKNWVNFQVCKEFSGRGKNEDVVSALESYLPKSGEKTERNGGMVSKFFGRKSH